MPVKDCCGYNQRKRLLGGFSVGNSNILEQREGKSVEKDGQVYD